MGSLNTGDYANDSFVASPHRPVDPKVKQQIRELIDRAERVENKRLDANANDIDALYARGVTRAQFSTYTALIERAWFSALRSAVGARRDHERVLELSPGYTDAKLIVGAHNYVMGSLPWAVKAAVTLVRLSGNKDKGIQYLYDAAAGNGETSVDAKILLALFLRREKNYGDALKQVRDLEPRYPQNVLLALEDGNLLRAAGKNAEAAGVYRRVWQTGREGHYGALHYEFAALNLGDLLRGEKNYADAAAAYEQVKLVTDPDPEVLQKADLGAGEMYDLLQKRDLAVKKYESVVAINGTTPPAETARKRIKEPYRAN
jgi:tetratricopeptide (TPR) repeat protein